jgi:MoaA/NifB/PqqE/SkfB family radical SAM enzyme
VRAEFRPSMLAPIIRWHLTKKTMPILCHIIITNRCNYNCRACFVDQQSPQHLEFNRFKNIIDDLKKGGCCYLYISGGEPLLIPGIADYLSYAAQRIPYVHMVTNGSLAKGKLLDDIAKSGISEISVSLDGLEATHDTNRVPGAFSAAVEAIEALQKRKSPAVTCSTTIGLWNAHDMQGLSQLLDSLGTPQRFIIYQDYPLSASKRTDGRISPEALDTIRSFVLWYLSKHADDLLPFAAEYFQCELEGRRFDPQLLQEPCVLPLHYVNILWNGEVMPCLGMRSSLYPGVGITGTPGDFMLSNRRGILDILRSEEYNDMQRKLKKCRECFRYFASCYVRPRLSFPIGNFIKYKMLKAKA